jgi:hypothetical protein
MFGLEWVLKGLAVAVLWLLKHLGWKQAGEWLDRMIGGAGKSEPPVV